MVERTSLCFFVRATSSDRASDEYKGVFFFVAATKRCITPRRRRVKVVPQICSLLDGRSYLVSLAYSPRLSSFLACKRAYLRVYIKQRCDSLPISLSFLSLSFFEFVPSACVRPAPLLAMMRRRAACSRVMTRGSTRRAAGQRPYGA